MSLPTKYLVALTHRRVVLAAALLSFAAGVTMVVLLAHMLRKEPMPPLETKPAAISQAETPPEPLPPPIPPEEPEPVAAPPAIVPAPPAKPAWQAFAVPTAATRPMVAIIIDDMGLDRRRSQRIVDLPGPLTISFMTYAGHPAAQAAEAHIHGHELMMHMPMQPLSASFDAGPDVLTDQLPPAELRRRIDADLARFDGYVGVNNHMGSRFTADGPGMRIVMEELRKHGLLFIDSMTTGKSMGQEMARSAGVPFASRDIFLDDVDAPAKIAEQLTRLEAQARRTGSAIAIGHPRDNTIAALAAWLPGLAGKGIALVPVTAVVKARMTDPNERSQ